MEEYVTRRDRLNAQQAILANGMTLVTVMAVAFDCDQKVTPSHFPCT